MIEKLINIDTQDGTCDAYVAYPEGIADLPIVLFYMDAIGLRPRIFSMASRLASHGYFVLAPNLFYRSRRVPIIDYDTLLKPENRPEMIKQVMALAGALEMDMARRDVQSFLGYARSQHVVRADRAGAVGYCMGGAHALRAVGNYPDAFGAVASFHGVRSLHRSCG